MLRRHFLQTTAAAAPFILSGRSAFADEFGGMKKRVGLIGTGWYGKADLLRLVQVAPVEVVSLCDVDSVMLKEAGDLTASRQLSKKIPRLYQDYREMLKEKDLDIVLIATPDHWHALPMIDAVKAGADVYVQKPMTHNIREARLLTQLARDKKVVTQMGNQGASNPLMDMIKGWMDSDKIGKVSKVQIWTNRPVWPQGGAFPKPEPSSKPSDMEWDLWLGPAPEIPFTPNLHPFNWRGWWDYGTGALGDVGCHLMDIPFRMLGLNYPLDAECSVGSVYSQMWTPDYNPDGCPASSFITLHYGATAKNAVPLEMTWMDGGIRPSHPDIIPPDHDLGGANSANGVMMIGEKGIITHNINDSSPLMPKLYLYDGTQEFGPDRLESTEPEYGHQRKWVDACKAGFGSKEHQGLTSSFDYAGPMTETVLMGNLAIRSFMLRKPNSKGQQEFFGRRKLLWDGENMRITNLEEANQFVGRTYRAGFEV